MCKHVDFLQLRLLDVILVWALSVRGCTLQCSLLHINMHVNVCSMLACRQVCHTRTMHFTEDLKASTAHLALGSSTPCLYRCKVQEHSRVRGLGMGMPVSADRGLELGRSHSPLAAQSSQSRVVAGMNRSTVLVASGCTHLVLGMALGKEQVGDIVDRHNLAVVEVQCSMSCLPLAAAVRSAQFVPFGQAAQLGLFALAVRQAPAALAAPAVQLCMVSVLQVFGMLGWGTVSCNLGWYKLHQGLCTRQLACRSNNPSSWALQVANRQPVMVSKPDFVNHSSWL